MAQLPAASISYARHTEGLNMKTMAVNEYKVCMQASRNMREQVDPEQQLKKFAEGTPANAPAFEQFEQAIG